LNAGENTAIEINDRLRQALYLMENTDRCLFITGRAGTGKSTLLTHFCATTRKKPVVLAPTGVAALNVKGQTIHSFFNFYVDVTPQKIKEKTIKPRWDKTRLYKRLDTIIIDEVSMVRADLLDCIDVFLRMHGPDSDRPFGGVQMIFVGDLYQLPPVVTSQERVIFSSFYQSPYFFSAHVMESAPLEIIELEKVYRQKDPDFIDLLNRIRNNSLEESDLERLNSRHAPALHPNDPGSENGLFISLTATNRIADEINDAKLRDLKGRFHVSKAHIAGDFGKEYFPTSTDLQFKTGAQIMLLNNDSKKRWVNGSIGIIEAYQKDEEGEYYLDVALQDAEGETVQVYPYTWELYRYSLDEVVIVTEPVGAFTQFPFRLAWAITIHKSQGKTFDHVMIDIGQGAFAAGQMYVALSRCTSFEGVYLKKRIRRQDIRTDYRIHEFLTGYHYRLSESEMPLKEKIVFIQKAIREKTRVKITYLKANDTRSERVIIPLRVGEETYLGKAFPSLKARCLNRGEERTFRVDRILKMEVSEAQD
jgi:ATP-dependent DNA helicase PIF1